jgi:hypothetical protein
MSNEPNEILFNFGDLVRCDGSWPRVFKVDGYHVDNWFYPNEQYTEVVFDLVDAYTGEFLEADYEDLTLVETADKAEEYLRINPAPAEPKRYAIDVSHLLKEAETMAKEERKLTAREISGIEADKRKKERKEKALQIDDLLDIRKWNSDMLAKTNNEDYGDRVFAIDCELKKLTEVD